MIESLSLVIDCVIMAFTGMCFALLVEIAGHLKTKSTSDKQFDTLYEKSSCPPSKYAHQKKPKEFFVKRFVKKLFRSQDG